MTEAFNDQHLGEVLASQDIGLLFSGSAQTEYTNVVHSGTDDPTRLPVTWPLIVHSLKSRFITDDILHNECYAMTPARIKQSETDMYFVERLHEMTRRYRKVFSNAELVSCFKQGHPYANGLMLENNLLELLSSNSHYLYHFKQFVFTAGSASRACQAPLAST